MISLFGCERLKPVDVAGVLIGGRGLCIDILADIRVFQAEADDFEHGVNSSLKSCLLSFEHICQKSISHALNETTLELIGLLVNEIDVLNANLDRLPLVVLLGDELAHTEDPF